jgi:hypothetical protein
MSVAYKVMMNRPALGTVTLMDMIEDQEEAKSIARGVSKFFEGYGIEVDCYVVEYEEARHWDNTSGGGNRT